VSFNNYLHDEITLSISDSTIQPVRSGWLRQVEDTAGKVDLFRYVGGSRQSA